MPKHASWQEIGIQAQSTRARQLELWRLFRIGQSAPCGVAYVSHCSPRLPRPAGCAVLKRARPAVRNAQRVAPPHTHLSPPLELARQEIVSRQQTPNGLQQLLGRVIIPTQVVKSQRILPRFFTAAAYANQLGKKYRVARIYTTTQNSQIPQNNISWSAARFQFLRSIVYTVRTPRGFKLLFR